MPVRSARYSAHSRPAVRSRASRRNIGAKFKNDYQTDTLPAGPGYAIRSKLLLLRFAVLVVSAVIIPGLDLAQSVPKPGPRKLVVISVAGLDARFLAEPATRVKIPN